MLDEALRALLSSIVREAVRAELALRPEADEYLDVTGAADFAKVHPQTIRAWVSDGKLTEYRAGRELRVLRSELHACLAAGRKPPDPEMAALAYLSKGRKVG